MIENNLLRQTCSHDLAYRIRDNDVEDLGDIMNNEILICACLRCESAVPITNRSYRVKDDPKLYMHRRRGNDGVYQCITVFARLDKPWSNL